MPAAFAHLLFRCRLAGLVALALACGPGAHALDRSLTLAQLHHTAWSTRDGAPAQVESLAQTDDGMLWLGTATGVFRFDGLSFERFQPPPGQSGPTGSASALFAAPGQGLWIGYRFGGVGWWHEGRLLHFGRAEGLPPGTVTSLVRDADGHMWAATTNGLSRFDGTRWAPPQATGYPKGANYALHVDRAGTLWAVNEDGTWRLPRGGAQFERSSRSISFAWLAERADGRVWESNGTQGLWPLPDEDGAPPLRAAVPGPGHVGPLLFDRDGSLWVGSRGGVTRLVDPDHLPPLAEGGDPVADDRSRFGRESGLSGDQVLAILEDREGNVWVSTSGGLDRFRENKLTRAALPPDLLWPSLAPAIGGGVWVGSTEVAAARLGMAEQRLPEVGPRITSVLRDTRGAVWMGGARGLWRIAGEKASKVGVPSAIAGTPIQAMVDTGDGRLRLSVMRAGQWEQDASAPDGWRHVSEPPGATAANPLAMARDPLGRLWLGYEFDRLEMLEPTGKPGRSWRSSDGLHVGSILCLFPQAGRMWVGGEMGLAAIVGNELRTIHLDGGEPLAGVSGIVADVQGNVWLNTAMGIVRLPAGEVAGALAQPAHRIAAERMDYRDGLEGAPAQLRPVPTAVSSEDGRLWFATNNAVVWIDPNHVRRNPMPPPVQILELVAAQRSWPLERPLLLPVGTTEIGVRFTAGSLGQPERVRFRVRLVGVDAAWQAPGAQRSAHYANLGPGRYRFDVIAANEDGVWSAQPATLEFVLPPAFHQTWWFRLIWIPLGLALIWAVMRWRLKRLAERYADRHEARLIERERIARELHDTLLQGVQGLILRVQSGVDRMAPGDPVRQTLEHSLDRAEQVLLEGRDRVTDLRVPAREPHTLGEQLRRAGEELAEEHGLSFTATLRGEGAPLPDALREEIVCIVREALLNACRHAEASELRLALHQTPSMLTLTIADDGRGMPPTQEQAASLSGHWGLAGMRERARAIGGRLAIDSAPGQGTRIRLQVRLRRRFTWLLARWSSGALHRTRKGSTT